MNLHIEIIIPAPILPSNLVERRVHLPLQPLQLPFVIVRLPRLLLHEVKRILLSTVHHESEGQQERPVKHRRVNVPVDGIRSRNAGHDRATLRRPRHQDALAEGRIGGGADLLRHQVHHVRLEGGLRGRGEALRVGHAARPQVGQKTGLHRGGGLQGVRVVGLRLGIEELK